MILFGILRPQPGDSFLKDPESLFSSGFHAFFRSASAFAPKHKQHHTANETKTMNKKGTAKISTVYTPNRHYSRSRKAAPSEKHLPTARRSSSVSILHALRAALPPAAPLLMLSRLPPGRSDAAAACASCTHSCMGIETWVWLVLA